MFVYTCIQYSFKHFLGHLDKYVYKNKHTNINPLRSAGASSILSVDFVYFVKNLFFSSNVTQSKLIAETVQMKCLAQGNDANVFHFLASSEVSSVPKGKFVKCIGAQDYN